MNWSLRYYPCEVWFKSLQMNGGIIRNGIVWFWHCCVKSKGSKKKPSVAYRKKYINYWFWFIYLKYHQKNPCLEMILIWFFVNIILIKTVYLIHKHRENEKHPKDSQHFFAEKFTKILQEFYSKSLND